MAHEYNTIMEEMNRMHNEENLQYMKSKQISEGINLSTMQVGQYLIELEKRGKVTRWKNTQAAQRWRVDD